LNTRVLIVDDDPFIRESLKLILELQPDLQVAGVCQHGEDAVQFIREHGNVDLVLMDIRMPVCDGVLGTQKLKEQFPLITILILTTFDDDEYIVKALRYGASGYLLKNVPPDRIIEGIRSVRQGHVLIHPDIARKLSGLLNQPSRPETDIEQALQHQGLTATELTVVRKISEGLSNKEIAQELFLSEGTVKNYISEILGKLALRDRTQIAIYYLKQGRL
jgi:DNA-binding NarL/FixJ family response regulator